MLEVEILRKAYGSLVAVDGVSFAVAAGEIFGLLGPNGAGKTTTLHMICGILRPDDGWVKIDGQDIWREPQSVKSKLGVVPQEIAVYEDLTARDNLEFWASLYGLSGAQRKSRVDAALERVGLIDRAAAKVSTMSGGMKRRLNLAMGLLHQPRLLLLDEPTVGIDPQARHNILGVIREVAAQGTTILYTTHYMEEAQELCQRIAIVDHGKILAQGNLAELTRLAGEGEVLRLRGPFHKIELRERLARWNGLKLLSVGDSQAVLAVEPGGPGLVEVLPQLFAADLQLDAVSIQPPSLESVFLRLTGRELRD